MNILMPIYSCDPDGESERLVGFNWLSQISREHRVFLITPERYRAALTKRINSNVIPHYVRVPEFGNLEILSGLAPAYFVFLFKSFFIARRIIKTEPIDLIHRVTPVAFRFPDLFMTLPVPCLIGPVGGGLKPLATFPSVFQKESLVYQLRRLDSLRFLCDPWLIHTYRKAATIMVTWRYLYDIVPREYFHKLRVQSEVTINTNDYQFVLKRGNPVPKILYVGRFIPYKAAHLIIKALRQIVLEYPHLAFEATFVGDGGEYYRYCQRLVEELGLGPKVVFAGRRKRGEVVAYYHSHDIFCFPSLKESSGFVVLEAMSCGIPVIVADRGGPAEIVGPECGIRVPVLNEQDFIDRLKAAIVRLIEHKELRYFYATHARERMVRYYDNETLGPAVTEIYKDVMRLAPAGSLSLVSESRGPLL